jgi:glycosyltransferase involved in cell wall biosynthesis
MLTQFYPPVIGGEERHVANLSKALAERGHNVSVATLSQRDAPAFEVDGGIRLHRVQGSMQRINLLFSESSRQYAPPFPDPEVLRAFRRIIRDEQPDIIHAHNWIVHSFTPLKAWSRARLVMTLHDYSLVCVQKRLMRQGIPCSGPGFAKCLGCAAAFYGAAKGWPTMLANTFWSHKERQAVDMFFPVSQAVVEGTQLQKYRTRYRVIPNFVPDHIDSVNDRANPFLAQLPEGDFLLFVGDIMPDKGAEVLLEAYAQLNTHVPLVLIGRSYLPDLAKRLPPNVFFLGSWPHEAIMGAWSRCTLALIPSIVADSCPTVAMEAMYMGRPIIATRSGGLPDIVADEETGLLVARGDALALQRAIQRLLTNPEERVRMGNRAKQRVAEFQAQAVVSRIEQAYQELLDTRLSHTVPSQMLAESR